jgi:hypothetical protein
LLLVVIPEKLGPEGETWDAAEELTEVMEPAEQRKEPLLSVGVHSQHERVASHAPVALLLLTIGEELDVLAVVKDESERPLHAHRLVAVVEDLDHLGEVNSGSDLLGHVRGRLERTADNAHLTSSPGLGGRGQVSLYSKSAGGKEPTVQSPPSWVSVPVK